MWGSFARTIVISMSITAVASGCANEGPTAGRKICECFERFTCVDDVVYTNGRSREIDCALHLHEECASTHRIGLCPYGCRSDGYCQHRYASLEIGGCCEPATEPVEGDPCITDDDCRPVDSRAGADAGSTEDAAMPVVDAGPDPDAAASDQDAGPDLDAGVRELRCDPRGSFRCVAM